MDFIQLCWHNLERLHFFLTQTKKICKVEEKMFLLLIANCENEKGQLKNADLYIFQKNVTLFERFWKRRGPRFQSD